MNVLFEKNISLLQAKNPLLANAVLETPDVGIKVNSHTANFPELILMDEEGNERFYYQGKTADQENEFLAKHIFKNPRIVIFLGMGLGQPLLNWIRAPHTLTRQIIIVEPFLPVFKKALEHNDFSPLLTSKNVRFFVGTEDTKLSLFLGDFFGDVTNLSLANAVEYYVSPDANKLTPHFFSQIPDLVASAIAHQFNRHFGDPFDAYIGTQNFIQNMAKLSEIPAIDEAKNLFQNKPGIVIASGPSLTDCLPHLKAVQDRAVMAACPSALPAVLKQGITPHLWLNIERLENQGRFLESLPVKPPHVFVAPLLVHPLCFSGNGGLNSFILGNSLQSGWLKSPYPAIDLGHSSAHAAFYILQRLGCNPIYLVGQDLCYTDGATHAEDTWDESHKSIQNIDAKMQKFFEVMGNSGKQVKTNPFWNTYLKTFTLQTLPQYNGQVYNVIDASKGALIQGTQRMDPDNLVSSLPENFAILEPLTQKLKSVSSHQEWISKIKPRLHKVSEMLEQLAQDAFCMALDCKTFQFHEAVIAKDWEKTRPVYEIFMQKVMKYSSRYRTDEKLKNQKLDYEHFFHSIIQGLFLRYRIEYFAKAGEEKGDVSEINRKAEILFHMSKDEAFWAKAVQELIQSVPVFLP